MNILLIARFTFKEIMRRWIFLAMLLLTLLLLGAFALLLNLAFDNLQAHARGNEQMIVLGNAVLVSVLACWSVYLQSSVMTILLTAGMISAEVEAGTFAIIVPKPLSRFEILCGKWLAYALILSFYTALLLLAFLGVIYWRTGYWPEQVPQVLGMLELSMLTLLALTTLGSALWPTLVNGAVAVLLFIGTPLADIAKFVVPEQSATLQRVTTAINLIMPSDALWRGASADLFPSSLLSLLNLSAADIRIPLIGPQAVPSALFIWVALYIVALPLAGALRFQRRDL